MARAFPALVALITAQGAFAPAAVLAAPLREQQVIDFVANQVALRYQVGRERVDIEWQGPSLYSLCGGNVPDNPEVSLQGKPRLIGRTVLPVVLTVNGKPLRTIYPRLSVKVYQDVWVTTRPVHRGELFDPTMAKADRRSLETVMGSSPETLQGLEGARARREIPVGSTVVTEMFEVPPLVKSGALVSVKLVSGDLTIVTQGQVVTDGTLGQLVKVVNPDTHRDYVGRVTGNDSIEVILEEAP